MGIPRTTDRPHEVVAGGPLRHVHPLGAGLAQRHRDRLVARIRGPNGARGDIPAAEYDSLFKQFNPTKFIAREWVATAKAAGMKYLVFTTKHHDGFCEFDNQVTDYKISSPQSPFHRDVVKELADACHAAGIRFGVYYSQPDCHHPDYRTANHARYIEYLHSQMPSC